LETFKSVLGGRTPDRPFHQDAMLLFWSQPWKMGVTLSESVAISGSALVAVPLSIDRSPPGSRLHIPAPWLALRTAPGPDGVVPSGMYDNNRGRWSERGTPTSTWMRFQPPDALDPLEIQGGQLSIQVTGPIGKLEIAGFDGEKVVPLKQWVDPIGKLTLELNDPKLLYRDGRGGIFLRVAGGDPDRPELTRTSAESDDMISYWRIESFTLDLDAVIAPRNSAAAGG
jgi:hypothetical protein